MTPAPEGDLLLAEAVGVAEPVGALVVVADVGGGAAERLEEPRAR